jgi:uncharacterized protein YecE (DUF72 family)
MSNWHIGTIGFSYKDWVGEFYPKGLKQREYLRYYAKAFNSVEIDSTFHSIPLKSTVQSWSAETPDNFLFSLKIPRIITHDLRLQRSQGLIEEFLDSISPIYDKAGPILFQLPPSFSQDQYTTVADLLNELPASFRYAFEFRHPSWYNNQTTDLLAKYKVGWVSIDYPKLPRQINLTADFLYVRWIGVNNMYHLHSFERVDKSIELRTWIDLIRPRLDKISEIYGYFNNDYAGFAVGTCRRFLHLLGFDTDEPEAPYQERLF